MRFLPKDISTFETMILENYIYVDKTEHIYNLFKSGASRYYFFSHPRRFGKSLLISTLEELFSNNRKLFKNLWIDKSDFTWQKYPIIKFDFATISNRSPHELDKDLIWNLEQIAQSHNVDISKAPTLKSKFRFLIESMAQKGKVVLLVDEYDKPILDHINNVKLAETMREILREFYDTLKGMDKHLRAIFITGVTKFSKTSIFSGINHLNDISNTSAQAALLGYTQQELQTYFKDYIHLFAKKQHISFEQELNQLKTWYNGYRFSKKNVLVYNPFSILYYLDRGEFENYWFSSGTPSFLINLLRNKQISLSDIEKSKVNVTSLGAFNIENIPLVTLLFQAGYLTIKSYDTKNKKYNLGCPNLEVSASLKQHLLAAFTYHTETDVDRYSANMHEAIEKNDLKIFFQDLKILFAQIPYHLHIQQEKYYHSLFQLICYMFGLHVESEIATDVGRIDVTIITQKYIHIFEFKFNQSPDQALKQIEQKKYYQKYLKKKKKIILVGVSFNRTKKNLDITYSTKKI